MLFLLILWSTLQLLNPTTADPSLEEKEIVSVIRRQLDAFTFHDDETAYRFASKRMKDQFSQDQYAEMVRANYPQITQSIRVSFGEIRFDADPARATALAEITRFNHKTATAEYRMIHEEDGWKVDGVKLLPVRTSTKELPVLREIRSVIGRQLDAFKKDDYTGAYRFASNAFRKQFSRDRFEAMIRARFPEIARSAGMEFGKMFLYMNETRATVEIDVTGANARRISMEYRMVLEEGGWKTDDLTLLDPFRRF